MLCYGIGFFVLGSLGDKYNLKYYLAISGFFVSVSYFLLGYLRYLEFNNRLVFALIYGFNGFV